MTVGARKKLISTAAAAVACAVAAADGLQALAWWKGYVETGISPDYDEKRDEEILKALRTTTVEGENDVAALVAEAEGLKAELDAHAKEVADKEKKLKAITDKLKEFAKGQFRPGDKDVLIPGSRYVWKMTRSQTTKLDEKRLKADGLYDIYAKTEESYRMTVSEKKEG